MTPMERAMKAFETAHGAAPAIVEAACKAYVAALAEDEETVERVARGQMLSKFGAEAIVMFEPPKEATTEQRRILSDRVSEARKQARAALLALAKDK